MFRFIVCDDDDFFCKKEKQYIEEYYKKAGINVSVDIFHKGEEVVSLGKNILSYNAIFLDVSMERGNGVDIAEWLNKYSPKMIIVFVSGYMTYALDGYKVGAIRYIMKDDNKYKSSMDECLNCILGRLREYDETGYITISEERKRISIDRIMYVSSKAHRVYYCFLDKDEVIEYSAYGKLVDVENLLSGNGFFRVHQSYLVNMKYVKDVKRYEAFLSDGQTVPISKQKYKDVEAEFIRVKGTF